MSSISFPNLNSSRTCFVAALLACVAFATSGAEEQKQLKTEDATNIRFWNMAPRDGTRLSLISRRGENLDPVFNGLRGFDFTSYIEVEPKKYTFRLQDGTGKVVGNEVKVDAEKQRFFTLIAERVKPGEPSLRIVDDTYEFKPDAPIRLTVHQYIPGATAKVSVGNQPEKSVKSGESVIFDSLPKGSELRVQAPTPQGGTFDGKFPTDFADGNRLSCLIILDRYGEILVRMQPDGFVHFDLGQGEPAPAPSPAPNPSALATPQPAQAQ